MRYFLEGETIYQVEEKDEELYYVEVNSKKAEKKLIKYEELFDSIPNLLTSLNSDKDLYKCLVKYNLKKKVLIWQIWFEDNKIYKLFGQVNGKLQTPVSDIKLNNTGRDYRQQGELQINREIEDKKKKDGYLENLDQERKTIACMTASTWDGNEEFKKKVILQPKIDGVRLISYLNDEKNKVIYQSRNCDYYPECNFKYINEMLFELLSAYEEKFNVRAIFDGEVIDKDMNFNRTSGLVKQKVNINEEGIKDLEYHIFDIVDENLYNKDRMKRLKMMFEEGDFDNIKLIRSVEIEGTKENIEKYHMEFTESNYEGIMIRLPDYKYEGKRSKGLLKYKHFFDKEVEIVGVDRENRNNMNLAIFIVQDENLRYTVRPRGTFKEREEWYENSEKYIGKSLTIRYQSIGESGAPRFPVGIIIREN